jgi:acyl transferase domain-containing protein
VQQNGKGPGITHPGIAGQEAVIRKTYSKARLGYGDTGYFELHGTGTPVGDPIECAAVGNVFAPGLSPQKPLLLSALKSNIGHTGRASGLASMIKVVMSLERGVIPPIVGIKTLNSNSEFRNPNVVGTDSCD